MQTTARAGCWPWGLGDARVGHTVMTPEQRSRCDGAARCPPCPVGAPKRLSALAPTLSGAGTATVIWGKIEADAERMASRACHNGPASARCGPRRRGRRDWAGQRSGFLGPPGTAMLLLQLQKRGPLTRSACSSSWLGARSSSSDDSSESSRLRAARLGAPPDSWRSSRSCTSHLSKLSRERRRTPQLKLSTLSPCNHTAGRFTLRPGPLTPSRSGGRGRERGFALLTLEPARPLAPRDS